MDTLENHAFKALKLPKIIHKSLTNHPKSIREQSKSSKSSKSALQDPQEENFYFLEGQNLENDANLEAQIEPKAILSRFFVDVRSILMKNMVFPKENDALR